MSNPVSNAEVEDVLSSIRRLVSEDRRPLQTSQTAAPAAPVTASNGRLVLTPALRVAEPPAERPAPADRPRAAVPPLLLDDVLPQEPATQDAAGLHADPDAKVDADGSGGQSEFEAEHTLAADLHGWEEDEAEADAAAAADAEAYRDDRTETVADAPAREAAEPPRPGAQETGEARTSELGAKIAALETAINRIPERWEPDVPGSDEYSGTEQPAMAWEDDVDHDATGARLSPEPEPEPEPEMGEGTAPEEDEEPEAPQGTFFTRHSAAASRTQGAPATEEAAAFGRVVGAAPRPQAQDDDEGLAYGGEDQLIDEEALRDLVSEIVRAELQGALGERITRNVRKLVRREIHRALTAQELE
jgi:hypothetical protein